MNLDALMDGRDAADAGPGFASRLERMSRSGRATAIRQELAGLDWWLLFSTLLLCGLGLIMVYSASGMMAEAARHNDTLYYFKRQGIFFLAGLGFMGLAAFMPRRIMNGLTYVILLAALFLLVLTWIGPFKHRAGGKLPGMGAARWLKLGPFTVQPLEFAKIALVLYLGSFFGRKQEKIKTLSVGFLPPLFVTLLMCGLLVLQPDFGGAAVLALIMGVMCFVGGTRFVYLGGSFTFLAAAGVALVMGSGYRMDRWLVFLDPLKDRLNKGYQLAQSLYSLGLGGWFGQGLGAGMQKHFLPEAHNDFIMSVIGEELGFVGMTAVISIYSILLWRAYRIAFRQKDLRDRFTAFGLATILTVGFLFNLAVCTASVPPKGVAMPFLSYGGSNLLASLLVVGLLMNYARKPG